MFFLVINPDCLASVVGRGQNVTSFYNHVSRFKIPCFSVNSKVNYFFRAVPKNTTHS